MQVPNTLRDKLDLYRSRGRIVRHDNELFSEPGWLQVLHGQGVVAEAHHPLAGLLAEEEIAAYLGDVAGVIERCVERMPTHADFLLPRRSGEGRNP